MKTCCNESSLALSFYMDGELEPSEMKRLSAHIKSCAACRQKIDAMGQTEGIIRDALSFPPSIDFDAVWEGVQRNIHAIKSEAIKSGAIKSGAAKPRPVESFLSRIMQSIFRPLVLAPAVAACAAAFLIVFCSPYFSRHGDIVRQSSVESVSTRTGSVLIMQTATTRQPIIWILEPPAKEKSS